MFGLQVTVAPTEEPLDLDEAKGQCGLLGNIAHDTLLQGLITAARIYCERATGKAFITQTLKLTRDCFPDYREEYVLRLPRPPLQSLTPDADHLTLGIEYDDTQGVTQTLAASEYVIDTACEPGRVGLVLGAVWPLTIDQLGVVRVTYLAGYGARADVPQTIKQAMLLLIGHWFENREAVGTAGGPLALAVGSLLGCEDSGAMVGTYG
jgi:uncharacterized phiE125 gp8 family phage protein